MARTTKGKAADAVPAGPAAKRANRSRGAHARSGKSAAAIPKKPATKKRAVPAGAAPAVSFRRGRQWSDDLAVTIWDYIERFEHDPYQDVVPTITSLAAHIRCAVSTLYEWAKPPKDKEGNDLPHTSEARQSWADGMDVLMAVQGRVLINGGLTGRVGSVITKLMLAHHGYADRREVSGPDKGPIPIDQAPTITPEMSAEEAARIYEQMLAAGST